jgi:hypothetical protein
MGEPTFIVDRRVEDYGLAFDVVEVSEKECG